MFHKIDKIIIGGQHSFVLTKNGSVFVCGYNSSG
jgi:alpha-tubulin suppressor-like RCC1 family protein